ncbi:F-box/LRR-repeat protein [Spatholobus suberectus]|nr:F-box/LRR-repeat protein [Spatholobus suberectus]
MREEKEADTDIDIDMITQLPDPILQHILLFLPTSDAARMGTVSKSWLNQWNSLFLSHFSMNETTHSLENFMPWVDQSFSTLRAPEENRIIHSFVLNLHFVRARHPFDLKGMYYVSLITFIDDWISLVLKNCVKHIKLSFSNITYALPSDIFSAKSFLTLTIQGCSILGEPLSPGAHAPFNCLKELALLRVDASSYVVEEILYCSPLLEKVVLKEIGNMGSLKICNLPRLSYVEVEQTLEDGLKIEAPNLRTLVLQLYGSAKVYVSDCITWSGNYMYGPKFAFEHASLETLHLCFNSCARIEVECSHLRTMSLSNKGIEKPLDVVVDAPKLEHLNYEGYVIPSFHGMASHVKPTVTLKLRLGGRPGLDVAVRSCIEMFNQPIVHLSYLYGQFFKAQEILWPGQVQQIEVTSPPPKVKCLIWSLSSPTPAFAYPYLLDGSLCSCHPGILRVEALPLNRGFIEFLCRELFHREENPACCEDEPEFRCWRHYLKGVTVVIQSQSESEKPKTLTGKALMKELKYIDASDEFQVRMNWSRELI